MPSQIEMSAATHMVPTNSLKVNVGSQIESYAKKVPLKFRKEEEMLESPYINVKMNNERYRALIDSGATNSAISLNLYNKILRTGTKIMSIPVCGMYCSIAVGKKKERVRFQCLIEIQILDQIIEVIFLVIPYLAIDILLGSDLFYQMKTIIDYGMNVVIMNTDKVNVEVPFAHYQADLNYEGIDDKDQIKEETFMIEYLNVGLHEMLIAQMKLYDDDIEINELSIEYVSDEGKIENCCSHVGNFLRICGMQSHNGANELSENMRNSRGYRPIVDANLDHIISCKVREAVGLTDMQRGKLYKVLIKNRDVFSENPGRCEAYIHKFNLREEVQPYTHKCRPIPLAFKDKADKVINDMLRQGIIKPSNTPYVNPLCWVTKKNGEVRCTLDARHINSYTLADNFRPESIEHTIAKLGQGRYFSSLDLTSSFLQIPLDPSVAKYTGFIHNGKCYEYTRCAFGLRTSGAALLRALDIIFGETTKEFLSQYIDDFLLYEENVDLHIEHIDFVLTRLRENGMRVKPEKTMFFKPEVKFLGYVITENGIKPDVDRIESIKVIPAPKNVKQLRRFLGILQYQAKFIINYASEVAPLRELLRSDVKWCWRDNHEIAFNKVKELFAQSILLERPDMSRDFIIFTDASKLGYGAILAQVDKEGQTHVISTTSKGLTRIESQACITELEISAIYFALQKFRLYVFNRKIKIYTDHVSLAFMSKCKLASNRIGRYIHEIMSYDVEIAHISGKDNIFSDLLSRLQRESDIPENISHPKHEVSIMKVECTNRELVKKFKDVAALQQRDPQLLELRKKAVDIFEMAQDINVNSNFKNKLGLSKDILYKLDCKDITPIWKIYVPSELESDLIKTFHESMCHAGSERVSLNIAENFYIKKLGRKVRRIISSCDLCQRAKSMNISYDIPINPIIREAPNDLVCLDHHGRIPMGRFGNEYIFVTYDVFSKFVKIYPVRAISAKSCVNKLFNDYIPKYGPIKAILTDNATVFKGKIFTQALKEHNIKLYHSSLYHPQSNPCERIIKEIGIALRILSHRKHTDWVRFCPVIERVLNNGINPTTGYAPSSLMKGIQREPLIKNLPLSIPFGQTLDQLDELKCKKALEKIRIKAEKRVSRHRKKKTKWSPIIGDLVLVKDVKLSNALKKRNSKMELLYKGPFVIHKILGSHTYELTNQEKIVGVYHKQLLRPYKTL